MSHFPQVIIIVIIISHHFYHHKSTFSPPHLVFHTGSNKDFFGLVKCV